MSTDDSATDERTIGWEARVGRVLRPVRAYLVAHWKGEISLGVSFWINGAMLNGLLRLTGLAVEKYAALTIYLSWWAWVFRLAFLFLAAVRIWQFVGIWRSALRSKSGWGYAAMFCVLVGAASFGYQAFVLTRTAIRAEMVGPLFKDDADIHYDEEARAIVVNGMFGPSLAQRVHKAFAEHLDARAVVLQSRGGFLGTGIQLKALLESRPDMVVIADGLCASACTTAFLGGKRRLITQDAALGFHRASRLFDDPIVDSVIRETSETEKDAMRRLGASDAFIAAAFAKEGDALYFPDLATLRSNGIVHGWIRDLAHMDAVDPTGPLPDGDSPAPFLQEAPDTE
jgi:hypothetical protein